jgi:hypothetical protein
VVNERGRFLVAAIDYTNAESIHKERLKDCASDSHSECIGSDDAHEETVVGQIDRGYSGVGSLHSGLEG